MSTENIVIQIAAYRDPEGNPTCAVAEGWCEFLGTRLFRDVCMPLNEDLGRGGDDGCGYIQPAEQCPVWKDRNRAV